LARLLRHLLFLCHISFGIFSDLPPSTDTNTQFYWLYTQFSAFTADYHEFKTDVYSRLDSIENTQQDLMVRWVQRYGATSTPAGGANDDGGDEDSSQVDGGDNANAMDE
jgi:hypothetical protein